MVEMATNSSETTYRYEPLLKNQFRLLEITAVQPEISAKLIKCDVDQSPPFHALSYAWGPKLNTKAINLDNALFFITPHLHACLVSIFLENKTTPTRLWVDAICINQGSNSEKGAQVAKMHRLYHNADLVYVWLGEASDRSDEAMDAIRDISLPIDSKLASKEDMYDRILHLKSKTPKMFQMELFKPIAALSRRPWFQRLWVVQEYLLARVVIFICGRKTVESRKLRDTLRRMSIYSFDGNLSIADEDALFEGYNALINLERIKSTDKNSGKLTFFDFVMLGRSRLAKEPVDRIYAMLGLTEEVDTIYSDRLRIDYSEDTKTKYWLLYANFGKIALQNEPHLRLLTTASSDERPEGLPSWCPNLCSQASLDKLDEPDVFAAGWPWKDHFSIINPKYCTRHPHFKSPEKSHVTITENSNVISVWGARLDNILVASPKSGWSSFDEPNDLETIQRLAKGILEWFEYCEEFCEKFGKYGKTPSSVTKLWHALLTIEKSPDRRAEKEDGDNDGGGTSPIPISDMTGPEHSSSQDQSQAQLSSEDLDRSVNTHREKMTKIDEGADESPYIFLIKILTGLVRLNPEQEDSEEANNLLSEFHVFWSWLIVMDKDWSDRALFATEGGYLGCAPKDVAPGDVVCMLYGGRTLYVVRGANNGFRFVGEAYVYDCMDGQIFEMLDQGSVMEEEFSII